MALTLLKLGGELLEEPARLAEIASVIAGATEPLVVVHGGGREIDAALKRAGIAKRQVDGLRVTDPATLDVVVEVLAGAVNTRLVTAIVKAGGRAVGLTGADAGLVPVEKAPAHRSVDGAVTDLQRVGRPVGVGRPALAADLVAAGYVPVVASIAAGPDGLLYNVNADTLAADLAARLGAARLVIAGATPGVLDEKGETIEALDLAAAASLVSSGIASAGMIAKLTACREAINGGVEEVLMVDGRHGAVLARALEGSQSDLPATRMVAALEARAGSNR
jgi:acetylglutamate kinase